MIREQLERSFMTTIAPDHSECYNRDHYSFKPWHTYSASEDWCNNCSGSGINLNCYVGIAWGKEF
ncbi:uncharacterized protein PRCAT00002155001 [Priceomyces carsonii]|uniref:uncharacterized protein n=1 Tax=Priceomyces carsonii TaxID=28549 RepID=UPI002ED7EE6C|nr:unnamed protein product [Priceomyces carsonii]